ncbi:MAG: hypothetical protein AAB348_02460 [Patescibacteria group bacterium]
MFPAEFILNQLQTCSKYCLTEEDKKILQKGKRDFIIKKLLSKKFKKWSVDGEVMNRLTSVVDKSIKNNSPIKFAFPFGGYKLWRFDTAPEVDWSEFFAIAYFCEYISSILSAHEPGVIFQFFSDDIIIERMNNIQKNDLKNYLDSFRKLIECFKPFFPANLKIELIRIGDFYGDEFDEEINRLVSELNITEMWGDEAKREKMLKTSKLNYKFDGVEDFTELTETEKQKKLEMAVIFHEAYRKVLQKIITVYPPDKIVLSSRPSPQTIPLGSCKNSAIKFWCGYGILERDGDELVERILSYEQWKKLANTQYEQAAIPNFQLKNLQSIKIYPKQG